MQMNFINGLQKGYKIESFKSHILVKIKKSLVQMNTWFTIGLHSLTFWQDGFIYAVAYRPRWARDICGDVYNILVRHFPEYRVVHT